MANVKIDTENLRAGGQYISKSLSENENNYNSVKSINGSPCTSLENFKESLNTRFTNYSDHSSIASEKINECADSLEQIDTFIGSNVTNLLNSDMDLFATEDDAKLVDLALTSLNQEGYVNAYDPANLPKTTLYDCDGTQYFYQNGRYIKETFCPDSLKNSYDLKLLIIDLGYDPGYWIRADGVQMCGNDVMYGANIPKWNGENPANTTYRRGDKWYGTSGPGRIVGYGEASEWAATNDPRARFNGQQVNEWYDTYTAWWDGGTYEKRYYSKNPTYATENIINNPPLAASERYYQTNADWNSFFSVHPEFKPAGTENVTDWVSYFQQKNPEHGKLA